jgi:hypothetical protein
MFLQLLGGDAFQGNDVFKYRLKKVDDGLSSVWEFLFYDRFPGYVFFDSREREEWF